jgi:hypothetical protein
MEDASVEEGSGTSARIRTREMARSMRNFVGMQDLAELKTGRHRSDADGEHLRRQAAVNAGGALESERKNEERSEKCARSPGT